MRLLLVSNSTNHGEGYLDHCMSEMLAVLNGCKRVTFVPFALHDRDGYGRAAAERFRREGIAVEVLAAEAAASQVIEQSEAIFVGGGNTFRLLDTLQRTGLLDSLSGRVRAGAIYLGASAGTNLAAPTIRTTNDMPIVQPESFDALGFVPFQINCHYLDPLPDSTHMGETREQRLVEYLEENDRPVVGLREGAWIRSDAAGVHLGGSRPARIFRRGREPEERPTGSSLGDLL